MISSPSLHIRWGPQTANGPQACKSERKIFPNGSGKNPKQASDWLGLVMGAPLGGG